jgi:hypothetical protein
MLICTICTANRIHIEAWHDNWIAINVIYIITLKIQALSLIESHDLLGDKRTELRHNKGSQ